MMAGAGIDGGDLAAASGAAWSETVAGPWLAQTLAAMRRPETASRIDPTCASEGLAAWHMSLRHRWPGS